MTHNASRFNRLKTMFVTLSIGLLFTPLSSIKAMEVPLLSADFAPQDAPARISPVAPPATAPRREDLIRLVNAGELQALEVIVAGHPLLLTQPLSGPLTRTRTKWEAPPFDTLLWYAAVLDKAEIVAMLLARGAAVHSERVNPLPVSGIPRSGHAGHQVAMIDSPLVMASARGHAPVVLALLDARVFEPWELACAQNAAYERGSFIGDVKQGEVCSVPHLRCLVFLERAIDPQSSMVTTLLDSVRNDLVEGANLEVNAYRFVLQFRNRVRDCSDFGHLVCAPLYCLSAMGIR